ncbi:FAD-dependent monooxygenase [Bradyrhizobium sp. U87765 SZCCT0131]|uniref:FAD-dependent oxidoreductase n=1 Tax=unclassified Bradyrhizobium TaxID=2631580 RepID=UPI001BA4BEDA|nr:MULTISPECIES: NAD(P)/FAD-dependent oxidoreductase [unclassified Bradyrhizobium]MBR1218372.1 FAD-dependent monooxygenase [Bradyrhizobium sp. U87765 SZCCT0131]MBR1260682.1 FAD-dependent monooxygenase [Bradyrhizobium sp. U87765 SZCCT0134]MBR1303870.1 FAD-dependent monooxygenase [Bradyrhizobium sp. U87765 SZCCT0110]MBR1319476.1 FAD-dependent monooxygenase [Bradyrhizobium sp. U87765 SZCCT0109]MBR1347801.1 FAD-dependent monooxygenase [Bradyrhizobium sp. U87765 SZCCT0048]
MNSDPLRIPSRSPLRWDGRVAIIGAGLGGLCLAQGLRRAGIACDVYERDSAADSRKQGYRVRINAAGQRALGRCLSPELAEAFRDTCAVADNEGLFFDPQLAPVAGRAADTWRPSAVAGAAAAVEPGDLSADRQTLREVLLGGLDGHVHFGKSFRRFATDADGCTSIAFEDGTQARCEVLVAADGVNSQVRAQCWPLAQPVDTGAVCIYGKTPLTPEIQPRIAPQLRRGTSVVFADGFALVIDAMRFRPVRTVRGCALSPTEDYLYWAFIGPRGCFGFDPQRELPPGGPPLGSIVSCLTHGWHRDLRALFDNADRASLAVMPVRSAVLLRPWTPSAVTILGHAIHAMSPAGGLGANTALEDAASLATCLAQVATADLSPLAAIAAYEQDMLARAATALASSSRGAQRLFSPNLSAGA